MNINYENLLYSTLSQEANLFINKKILAQVGLNLAAFISFLIDKGRYHKANDELTEDGYFFATNEDIHLFTGLPVSVVSNMKKEGERLNLFKTKKLKNSFEKVTYYKLNFEVILSLLSSEKSTLELAYKRELPSNINYSQDELIKFGCRDLRLICKQLKVSYSGRDNKETMINKIIKEVEKKSAEAEESIENKDLDVWTKKSSIGGQKNCPSVDKKIVHQWTENSSIGGQKNCHKKNQNQKKQIQKNQISKDVDSLNIFEKLFEEFNITFTKTNQANVNKLLRTMKEQDVIQYLRETYENIKETPNVKSIARLFSSKIAKGERQIISKKINTETKNEIKEKNAEKENSKQSILTIENENTEINFTLEEEKEILEKIKKDPTVNFDFILTMKNINKIIYYNTLAKYK